MINEQLVDKYSMLNKWVFSFFLRKWSSVEKSGNSILEENWEPCINISDLKAIILSNILLKYADDIDLVPIQFIPWHIRRTITCQFIPPIF